MANKMLIDATHPEETRVVVLRGNRVEEFDFETEHRKQLRGNIYLAKVTRVEPSLQAAFIDYGGNRHGFLAFSEIHPDYYQIPVADRQALIDADARDARDQEDEDEGRHGSRRRGRSRQRETRRPERSDDVVQSDNLAAEENTRDAAEIPAGDASSNVPAGKAAPAHSFEAPGEAYPETPSIGETANPPVQAETAAPNPVHPETAAAETPPQDEAASGEDHHHAEPAGESLAPNGNGDAEHDHAHEHEGQHGKRHEEEEEIVESVGGSDAMEEMAERAPRQNRRQYKIQEVIKRRQVMLVQVVKEERGTKGAALTTYLSLAGRYSVLMPNTARGGGISRKITSTEDRKKLREIADELEVPEGMGVILRTAGAARTKQEVKRDFEYLLRLWETVRDLTLKSTAPTLVYEEGSLAKRSIRDLYSKDIEEIVVAGEEGYKDAKEFMRMLMPSHAKNVKLYKDTQPVFARYGIETQLDAMFSPTVQLHSGGYIVINQTEALVAIDVNSGRSTREHHIEDTALKTNVEAAEEVARQLRLRDLAGLIVIDFIDMDEKRNNRTVERRLKDALRNDRARIQVGSISHFGLMEMSRQRIRTSVLESSTEKCPHCGGTGHLRSVSSVALQLLRSLEETLQKGATHNQIVHTRPDIALYVLNHKRAHLRALEERYRITITINSDLPISGATSFTIERGELVMTLEQAKAIAAQAEASAPVLFEEEEPEVAVEEDEEPEAPQQAAADFEPSYTEGERDAGEREPREQEAGGREASETDADGQRRRRRRRGRGRGEGHGGEGREPRPSVHGSPDHMASANEAGADHQAQGESFESGHEGMPRDANLGPPSIEGGDTLPNGEPRRRRRGRRGGRRNRRDRDGQGAGDQGNQVPGYYATGDHDAADQGTGQGIGNGSGYDQPRAPAHDIAGETYAPRIEPTAAQPVAQPSAPAMTSAAPSPAPSEAPRRRSTVREPAPISSDSVPVIVPVRAPEPAEPAPAAAENKPRRTGWWAKRLLGDKG